LHCRPGTVIPFPFRGESPRRLDTQLYEETNEKDSWGPRSLWPTRRFRVNSREVLVLYRKRERARCTHEHGVFVRFRYNDLKEAARGCGGRGHYANSMVRQSGVEVRGDCAATRPYKTPCANKLATTKKYLEEGEKRDLFDGKAPKSGACGGTRRFRVRESRFMSQR